VRTGGRVATIYVGQGELAGMFSRQDDAKKRKRLAEKAAEAAERRKAEAEDREFDAWFKRVEMVATAAMMAAGYRKHNRSTWRKTRGEA
jgi:hypothetical protein